jgi:hypothetical protein
MNISDINTDFTEGTEPRDEHLLDLLKKAYSEEISCRYAMADMSIIKPYSNFVPDIRESFRLEFRALLEDGAPPALHVYAQDEALIMSDDYNSYWMYKELGLEQAICIVIGNTPALAGVEYYGGPFHLSKPEIKIVDAPPKAQPASKGSLSPALVTGIILGAKRTKPAYQTSDEATGQKRSFLINYPHLSTDSVAFLARTSFIDIPKYLKNAELLSQGQLDSLVRLFEDYALAGYILSNESLEESKEEVLEVINKHHIKNTPKDIGLTQLLDRGDVKGCLVDAYLGGWFEVTRNQVEVSNQEDSL